MVNFVFGLLSLANTSFVLEEIRDVMEKRKQRIEELRQELGIAEGWIRYDAQQRRIELPLSLAEELADAVSVPVHLVEVHPTHDRLEVGMVHLNTHR